MLKDMATAAGSSEESEALRISIDHLVNSIDTAALLPKALSIQLISEHLREVNVLVNQTRTRKQRRLSVTYREQ